MMQQHDEMYRVRSADWAKYTQGFWAPLGGLAMTLASLNRDLGHAAGSRSEVRLTLALATIAQAREALNELQLAVAQAREEARR